VSKRCATLLPPLSAPIRSAFRVNNPKLRTDEVPRGSSPHRHDRFCRDGAFLYDIVRIVRRSSKSL
jgi:hypothetical protein